MPKRSATNKLVNDPKNKHEHNVMNILDDRTVKVLLQKPYFSILLVQSIYKEIYSSEDDKTPDFSNFCFLSDNTVAPSKKQNISDGKIRVNQKDHWIEVSQHKSKESIDRFFYILNVSPIVHNSNKQCNNHIDCIFISTYDIYEKEKPKYFNYSGHIDSDGDFVTVNIQCWINLGRLNNQLSINDASPLEIIGLFLDSTENFFQLTSTYTGKKHENTIHILQRCYTELCDFFQIDNNEANSKAKQQDKSLLVKTLFGLRPQALSTDVRSIFSPISDIEIDEHRKEALRMSPNEIAHAVNQKFEMDSIAKKKQN
ncbi:hypothetical protein TKK_0007999 [Trichogramma kaykai]